MSVTIERDTQALRELAMQLDGRPLPDVRMTAEEFLAWWPDDLRAEWSDGEVTVMPPASEAHEDLASWLGSVLRVYVDHKELGTVYGSNLAARVTGRLRVPDICFIRRDRTSDPPGAFFDGAPDLVVEVVSRDSRNRDRREKFADYDAAGVKEYWLVDSILRTIDLYVRDAESGHFREVPVRDGKLSSSVLPGFYLRPDWITPARPKSTYQVLQELIHPV